MSKPGNFSIKAQGDRDIVMTREFNAPRHLVYEAHTKPELVKRWLGAFAGWTFAVCGMDVRVGGKYRWVWRNQDGREMGMGGAYREIAPNERIVSTEQFDDPWYEGEAVVVMSFVEKGGKTTLSQTMTYGSKTIRDSVLASPMEKGVIASYDALEKLLVGV